MSKELIWADNKNLWVKCNYESRFKAKVIPGGYFSRRKKAWKYPLDLMTFKSVVAQFPVAEINPDTLEKVRSLKTKYKILPKIKSSALSNPDPELKNFLGLPLFDHQWRSLSFYSKLDVAVDFSEPGVGKTAIQIGLIKYHAVNNGVERVLIICPLAIMDQWKTEINRFLPNYPYGIHTMDKGTQEATKMLDKYTKGIFIINYEKTWRLKSLLLDHNFEQMIVDESSRIKNHSAKQSKAIHTLSESVKYKSILTGTPAPNTYLELFSQMKVIDPNLFGSSFYAFRDRYYEKKGWDEFNWYPKAETEAEIKHIIDLYAMSWKKDECLDLPKLTTQILYCNLSKQQEKMYQQMQKWMVAFLDEQTIFEASVVLTKLLRLSQITSGFIQNTEGIGYSEFTPNNKLNLLKDLVENIPSNRKVIIWAIFHADIELIHRLFPEGESVTYYGGNSTKHNSDNMAKFRSKGNSPKILIANPKSAGMGLDLSCASYSIYFSMNYSFENFAQSRERFNRTGQKHPMTEYIMLVRDTIDEIIYDAVMGKRKVNEYITTIKKHIKNGE